MPKTLDGSFVFPSSAVKIASGKLMPERYCAVSWNSEKLLYQKQVRQDKDGAEFQQSTTLKSWHHDCYVKWNKLATMARSANKNCIGGYQGNARHSLCDMWKFHGNLFRSLMRRCSQNPKYYETSLDVWGKLFLENQTTWDFTSVLIPSLACGRASRSAVGTT